MGKHWPGRVNPRGLWPKGTTADELVALFTDPVLGLERRRWFRSYVRRRGECDEWMGSRLPFGYGQVNIAGRTYKAHRLAWMIHHKEDPEPWQVCHRCDNPPCTRKGHLFKGSAYDNIQDAVRKGRNRTAHGTDQPHAKLDDDKVREIRNLHEQGWGYKRLAKRFGVARQTVRWVVKGITWKHVV